MTAAAAAARMRTFMQPIPRELKRDDGAERKSVPLRIGRRTARCKARQNNTGDKPLASEKAPIRGSTPFRLAAADKQHDSSIVVNDNQWRDPGDFGVSACRPALGPAHHLPVFGMEAQGSCGGRAGPFWRSSMEMFSGERTKAM